MARLKEAWFEFAGIRSDAMGIRLVSMPTRGLPVRNGEFLEIPGRDGALWQDDGNCGMIDVRVECHMPEGYTDEVAGWLIGEGDLRFSDDPDRVYHARIARSYQRMSISPRLTGQKFTVTFACQPHRFLSPGIGDIVYDAPGALTNPATAPALPKIRIEGSGDFTVTVGDGVMVFEGIEGGVVVDSEAMECLNLAEDALLNANAYMDAYPALQPGDNAVMWTGNVSKITITPRWRYL